jgi:hypothetical protein
MATAKEHRRFHLEGIPPAPRGIPQIEVTFDIDANGILHVSAKDKGTGKMQQIRIEASSGLTESEIKKMKEEAEMNAEADRKMKEEVDKVNSADALIFQTEKQLKEFGDKLPADKKGPIEQALNELKEAHKNRNLAMIDTAMTALNTAWQARQRGDVQSLPTGRPGSWSSAGKPIRRQYIKTGSGSNGCGLRRSKITSGIVYRKKSGHLRPDFFLFLLIVSLCNATQHLPQRQINAITYKSFNHLLL